MILATSVEKTDKNIHDCSIETQTQIKISILTEIQLILNEHLNKPTKPKQHETRENESLYRIESQKSIEQTSDKVRVLSSNDDDVEDDDEDQVKYTIPLDIITQDPTTFTSSTCPDAEDSSEEEEKEETNEIAFDFEFNSHSSPFNSNFFSKKKHLKRLRNCNFLNQFYCE